MTELAQLLEDAGLTGRGGAAFPTVIKIRAAIEKRARLIVNVCDAGGRGRQGTAGSSSITSTSCSTASGWSPESAPNTRFAAHRGSVTAARLAAAGLPVLETPDRYGRSRKRH